MSKEKHIKKGMLSEKMSNFKVEPPEGIWEDISSQLQGGRSRKPLFIILAAAAGLALAITVGVHLMEKQPETTIAESPVKSENPAKPVEQSAQYSEIEDAPNEITHKDAATENIHQADSNRDITIATPGTSKKPDRFEEKVLIAMEEVIEEAMEENTLAESLNPLAETEEIAFAENIEQAVELENIEQNEEPEIIEQTEETNIGVQARMDSLRIAELMDSISNLNLYVEEIIPDINEAKSRWQLGASLTPLYSYRDVSSSDILKNQAVNSSETGVLAYSGGMQVRYLQSDRFSIESGIIYSRMGLAIGDYNAFFGGKLFIDDLERSGSSIVSLSNSIGTIVSGDVDLFANSYTGSNSVADYQVLESAVITYDQDPVNSFTQSFEYLEIPFNLRYKILDRNLDILLIGGLSTNLLVGNHVSANTINGRVEIGQVQDIRSVNYSGNAGIGFVYSFQGNFSLSIEPRFRYYLNSINESSLPVTHPYTMGVYTGVNYTF